MTIEDAIQRVSQLKPDEKVTIAADYISGVDTIDLNRLSQTIMLKAEIGYSVEVTFNPPDRTLTFHKIRDPVETFILYLKGLSPGERTKAIERVQNSLKGNS